MEVILLEKIRNLGAIGDKVKVKTGYARNFLLPKSKAVTATVANIDKFAKMRGELEKAAALSFEGAERRAAALANFALTIPAKATEEGKLFGSISIGTIVAALHDVGHEVKKSEVSLPQGPIRQIGEFNIDLLLHTDVTTTIKVNVVAEA